MNIKMQLNFASIKTKNSKSMELLGKTSILFFILLFLTYLLSLSIKVSMFKNYQIVLTNMRGLMDRKDSILRQWHMHDMSIPHRD